MNNIAKILNENKFFNTLFDSIPIGVVIVNSDLDILSLNNFMKRSFRITDKNALQKSIGRVIQCMKEYDNPGVCGKSEHCKNCQILRPALSALKKEEMHRNRADVEILIKGQLQNKELIVTAVPVEYKGEQCAIVIFEDITELSNLRRQLKQPQSISTIIGVDPQIVELREKIKALADINVPVFIQGETGTGKELIAQTIHAEGSRKGKPFVAVNCGALPEALLESELFGYVKGAFTGANRDKKGRFQLADGGTIFLDEIGDISNTMQVKLLRVLQEGIIEPLGSEKSVKVDVRILSATNKNIRKQISSGEFREDLFYRLCVVPLHAPPLRERKKDIPLLAEHILNKVIMELGKNQITISPSALDVMTRYDWPGNIREMQNVIQHALILSKTSVIEPEHILPALNYNNSVLQKTSRKPRRRKIDVESVRKALLKSNNNKVDAAQLLGVSRSTLYRFLETMDD